MTQNQSQSNNWHHERKLQITSSILKTVCQRKPQTDIKPFIISKLAPKLIHSPTIRHGQQNENNAIKCYVEYQKSRGHELSVCKCGLCIDPAIPWLAATPDGIVEYDTDSVAQDGEMQNQGCLEVKWPYLCLRMLIFDVSQESSSSVYETKTTSYV